MDKETIKWMTGREKYKTTFREFAVACHLDYDFMKEGVQMNELPKVEEDEAPRFYKGNDYKFLHRKGLKRESSVLNYILHCTLIPKGGVAGKIRMPYFIAINMILDGV